MTVRIYRYRRYRPISDDLLQNIAGDGVTTIDAADSCIFDVQADDEVVNITDMDEGLLPYGYTRIATDPAGSPPTVLYLPDDTELTLGNLADGQNIRRSGTTIVGSSPPASGSAVGSTSDPTSTSSSFVAIPEMSVTLTTSGGKLMCQFQGAFNVQHNDDFTLSIFVDGVEVPASNQRCSFFGGSVLGLTPAQLNSQPIYCIALVNASSGEHTVTARWKAAAGTARAITTQRQLIVTEIK